MVTNCFMQRSGQNEMTFLQLLKAQGTWSQIILTVPEQKYLYINFPCFIVFHVKPTQRFIKLWSERTFFFPNLFQIKIDVFCSPSQNFEEPFCKTHWIESVCSNILILLDIDLNHTILVFYDQKIREEGKWNTAKYLDQVHHP